MKNWRVVLFGVAGFSLFVLLPFHDHIFAAAGAILIIAGAILGFLWRPGSEIFYVQTLVFVGGPSHRGKTFQLFLRPRPAIGALDFHTHTGDPAAPSR
jgi:hypothetical protein